MKNNNQKILILSRDKKEFLSASGNDREFYWFYLGRNYEKLLDLRQKVPKSFHFVDIGEQLNSTAYELRRPYLDYIGELSVRFNSLAWWISRVAEKNVMVSPLFLFVCYLHIIRHLMKGELKEKNICIISESPALLETISRLSEFKNYSARKRCNLKADFLKAYLRSLVRLLRFIGRVFRRSTRPVLHKGPVTILRTWVSDKNLGSNGEFHDSYFPCLFDYFKRNNVNVYILPIIFNIKKSYADTLRWFRRAKVPFIIPEDYYHLSDYLGAVRLSYKSHKYFRNSFVFNGFDLSLLFKRESLENLFASGVLNLVMHYYLFKHLK